LLGGKNPKFEIYIGFKLHLIHCTAQVIEKMMCGAVMIFVNFKPHHTAYVTAKMRCDAVMVLFKPHHKVRC